MPAGTSMCKYWFLVFSEKVKETRHHLIAYANDAFLHMLRLKKSEVVRKPIGYSPPYRTCWRTNVACILLRELHCCYADFASEKLQMKLLDQSCSIISARERQDSTWIWSFIHFHKMDSNMHREYKSFIPNAACSSEDHFRWQSVPAYRKMRK